MDKFTEYLESVNKTGRYTVPVRFEPIGWKGRYLTAVFDHPVHGKKMLGCLTRGEAKEESERKALEHRFSLNCGHRPLKT